MNQKEVPAGTAEKICPVCKLLLPLDRACCATCGHWFRTYFVVSDPKPQEASVFTAKKSVSEWNVFGGVMLTVVLLLFIGLIAGVVERHSPIHHWVTGVYQSAIHNSSATGT